MRIRTELLSVREVLSLRRTRPDPRRRMLVPLALAVLLPACIEHPFHPPDMASRVTFVLGAVELDPWPNSDEDLGEEVVGPQDNEQVKQFFHDGDEALEVTLGWEVEEDGGSSGGS